MARCTERTQGDRGGRCKLPEGHKPCSGTWGKDGHDFEAVHHLHGCTQVNMNIDKQIDEGRRVEDMALVTCGNCENAECTPEAFKQRHWDKWVSADPRKYRHGRKYYNRPDTGRIWR